ncbi:MAG: RNA pseudouridine synthase [Bacteroidetes bacterium]|nr:RNA pseudouridine synthase [Bacteroidota bacterium]MCL1968251.1 RNA pseudouridine synthase [Bacteroidota bacterium]
MKDIVPLSERILYEDNHLIIVHKLAGEIVQADKTGDEPLSEKIRTFLKEKYQKPGNVFVGIVHRIDRPVSGIVIYAKTSKGLLRMNEVFKHRKIRKFYHALVEQKPQIEEQTLEQFIRKNEKLNRSVISNEPKEGYLNASLHYKYLTSTRNYHLLEVELFTGRHHQIRAQLSANGACIKGDLKYGAKRSNPDGSISLQAQKVIFEHPIAKKIIEVETPFGLINS